MKQVRQSHSDRAGRFHTTLSLFSKAFGIAIARMDTEGALKECYGHRCEFCDLLQQEEPMKEQCARIHREAGEQSARFGNSYFFSCHAHLYNFSIALYRENRYDGSLTVGPFLLDYPEASMMDELIGTCHIPAGCRSLYYNAMKKVEMVDPDRINYIAELLFQIVSTHLISTDNTIHLERKTKELQQEMINTSIQQHKSGGTSRSLHEQKELQLSELIRSGNLPEAQELLNDLLGGIYFDSGNDVELIKMRITELITVISRRIAKKGAMDSVFDLINVYQKKTARLTDLSVISYELGELLERMIRTVQNSFHVDSSEYVQKSLNYLHMHYREKITLEDLAEAAAVSPGYLSRIFKANLNVGFPEYLTRIRLEKAKELLAESTLPIADIAQYCGFANQQYFTRMFKKDAGRTPAVYRRESR